MALPSGFGGLSKKTSPVTAPASGTAKPAPAPVAAKPVTPAPLVRPMAKPATPPAPMKTKSQLMREEAERLEAEEAAASASNQESVELAAEAAIVHETEVEVVEPEPVAKSPARGLTTNPFSATLSKFAAGDAVNALAAFAEIADQGGGGISLYPTLNVSGGDQGGLFVAPKWQAEEVNLKLPEGRKPLQMVYLGYRIEVAIWPEAYDQNNPKRAAPINTAIIPCNDTDAIRLMTKATQGYQFTKKELKSKFDAVTDDKGNISGSGHPRPSLEIICYAPCIKGLLVVRSAPGFGPVQKSISNLARLVDPVTKTIPMFPGEIRVLTDEEKSKSGQVWKTHYFDFASDLKESGKKLATEFDSFAGSFTTDKGAMETFNEWMTGADKKITDEIRDRLRLATTL